MGKIYVIADESLGGVSREYVESPEYCFGYGDYVVVKHTEYKDYVDKYQEEMIGPSGCCINLLRPTDTVVIDGSRYRLVDRKADVGEKVIVIKHTHREDANGVFTVDRTHNDGHIHYGVYGRRPGGYHVLEPLDSEESPQVTDLLANLARRVASLEQQLRDTQNNVQRQAEELANAKFGISSLTCDVIALDDRTQIINAIAKFYEEGNR